MDYCAAAQSPASSFSELDHTSISSSWLSCGRASNTISFDGEDDEIVWSLSSSPSSLSPHRQTEEPSVTFESLVDFAAQGIPPPDGDDFVLIGSRSSDPISRTPQQAAERDTINSITKALASSSILDEDVEVAAPRIVWSEECEESLASSTKPQSPTAEAAKG